MNVQTRTIIDSQELDALVTSTYQRPYCFQQQEGCQDRGQVRIHVPSKDAEWHEEEMHDVIPEEVNGDEMGVKFTTWLARDPKQPVGNNGDENWAINLFWYRNFYPSIHTLMNDLHAKGLVAAGVYYIDIDW
jgi:hypothetical protein